MSASNFDLNKASKEIEKSGDGIPPLEKWNPDFCGDIDMRIARDGRWFYMGTPIGRPAMVKLFSKVLWQEENKFFLKTPVEKVGIQVEDAPFLFISVEEREGEKAKELCFTSLTDDVVVAGADHPITVNICPNTHEPSPYIDVRFGMRGLINRTVFYQLVEIAEEKMVDGRSVLVVESQGEVFELGAF
ncbi:DUF1285 domain-containing protein [Neptuniibacter sp.]|uniref:DUF1285 domain-containing protein n=1 Tax=Neptuniibacter sp. TaxID=1962643 RepID=UPI00262D5486|nr:DUF1285 domain-containing protein [Neptuniibacter sp.]